MHVCCVQSWSLMTLSTVSGMSHTESRNIQNICTKDADLNHCIKLLYTQRIILSATNQHSKLDHMDMYNPLYDNTGMCTALYCPGSVHIILLHYLVTYRNNSYCCPGRYLFQEIKPPAPFWIRQLFEYRLLLFLMTWKFRFYEFFARYRQSMVERSAVCYR